MFTNSANKQTRQDNWKKYFGIKKQFSYQSHSHGLDILMIACCSITEESEKEIWFLWHHNQLLIVRESMFCSTIRTRASVVQDTHIILNHSCLSSCVSVHDFQFSEKVFFGKLSVKRYRDINSVFSENKFFNL